MPRRVGLQYEALGAPSLFSGEIGETGAAARAEGLPVVEDHVNLGVARDRPHPVARQADHRPRLAQFLVFRKRVLEKLAPERIDFQGRRFRTRGKIRCWLSHLLLGLTIRTSPRVANP